MIVSELELTKHSTFKILDIPQWHNLKKTIKVSTFLNSFSFF